MLVNAIRNDIFDAPAKFFIVFLLIWLIITFASWVSFQLWWDRKNKISTTSKENHDFVATPVFAHLIQTLGEWFGTWIGIVGTTTALFTTLFLGSDSDILLRSMNASFLQSGFLFIVLMPIIGFLIIIFSRFIAEQIRALSAIANNTKKN